MKILFLSGYGIDLSVDSGRLVIRDGRALKKKSKEIILKPKGDEYDGIVIYGHSGNVSLDAMKWLSKQNIPLTILNWDGRVLVNVLIPELKQGIIRMAQYDAYRDERRLVIAKSFIEAKISSSVSILDWIASRYPEIKKNCKAQFDEIQKYRPFLAAAKTPKEVMGVEGMVAKNYWSIIQEVIDDKFGFEGRVVGKKGRPMGAVDPVNVLFNYGYAMLETQCWVAVNGNGLDPYVGFLHEAALNKAPLVYDLQEPFRWLVDVAVLKAIEQKEFKKSDFIRTENYNLRLKPEATRKMIELVNAEFVSKVEYKGKNWEWRGIIQQKAGELADYLRGRKRTLDFSKPNPTIVRDDTAELREKILAMDYADWRKMGYSKGTLHQLKVKVEGGQPFNVYKKVMKKLDTFGSETLQPYSVMPNAHYFSNQSTLTNEQPEKS